MTEEQVMAGAVALCLAIWSKKYSNASATDQKRTLAWSRDVLAAAEALAPVAPPEPPPPPMSEVDRIWRHLVEASSS